MLVKDVYINAIARVLGADPTEVERELKFTLFFYPSAIYEECDEESRRYIESASMPNLRRALTAVLSRNGVNLNRIERNLLAAGFIEKSLPNVPQKDCQASRRVKEAKHRQKRESL